MNYLSSWAQYSILAKSNNHRKQVLKHLENKSIPSMIYYPIPLHEQTVNSDLNKAHCPVASDISNRIFSIPMHPYISEEEQQLIISALNEF